MSSINRLELKINCVNFTDVAHFGSFEKITDTNINIVKNSKTIINREIFEELPAEIFNKEKNSYVYRYNTKSIFADLKKNINFSVPETLTYRKIAEIIFNQTGVTADFTNWASTNDFKGTKINDVFVDFENASAIELLRYCLAIDGYAMLIGGSGNVFFKSITSAADISNPQFLNLNLRKIKRKKISGIKIYNCDKKTDNTDNILYETGTDKKFFVHRFFGDDAEIPAQNFADNIINGFSDDIEKLEFVSFENYEPGGIFSFSDTELGLNADFMILKKDVIENRGTIEFRYTAYKKNQAIQLFLSENIFDDLYTKNNFRTHENLQITNIEEDEADDTISIISVTKFFDGTQPKLKIKFTKDITEDVFPQDFRIYHQFT